MRRIRWGLMGAGNILNRVMNSLRQMDDDMELVAIASRTKATAEAAAAKFGIPQTMTYDEMASSDQLDAVYIPVPHDGHMALTLQALSNHKAVLVEKPIALDADQTRAMIDCARRNHTFLMEAMWTRCFPLMQRVRELIGEKGIGDIRMMKADFGSRAENTPRTARLFDPAAGGGALLDLGVYCLTFADMLMNREPVAVNGFAAFNADGHRYGVDEQDAITLMYDRGELAQLACAVRTDLIDTGVIIGTKGRIDIPGFWRPTRMTVTIGGDREEISLPVALRHPEHGDEGFSYEFRHVNDCLRRGLTESPVVPLDTSLRVMTLCDRLRAQWGYEFN